MSVYEQKKELRYNMRTRRAAWRDDNTTAAQTLAQHFLDAIEIKPNSVIASYQAFRGEIDVTPLTDTLRTMGHKIVLPFIVNKGEPLRFHLYQLKDILMPNAMGVPEPDPQTPVLEPDILLVPLLAFDKERNRLGYGGGFYDRTIALLRQHKPITAVGIAYSFQEVADVPTGMYDVALDKIVTEVNVF